jgi:iron complex outermembrane receptor protein
MQNTKFKYAVLGATSLAVMATSQVPHAFAQEADDDLLDVIYVTARKREETQIEVPLSVKAFSQDDLDKRGIQASAELSDYVVGFKFEPVGTGGQSGRAAPNIRFRGVGVQVGLGGSSSAGALFWDGAFVAQGIGVVPLIDLQQTEVIKGPQTAFFGRNTFAGAVNFIPSEPSDELEVRLRGQASATDVQAGYNFNAIVSGPITEKIGARIALSTENRPGVVDFQDGTALGEETTHAILGTLKFDVTENTVLKASGYFVDSEDTSALGSINGSVGAGECNLTYSGTVSDIVTGQEIQSFSTDLSQSTRDGIFCGSVPDWDPGASNQFTPVSANAPDGSFVPSGFETSQTVAPELADGFIDGPDGLGNTYRTWRIVLSGEHELGSGDTINGFVSFGNNKNWGIFDNTYGQGRPERTSFFVPGVIFPADDINYTGFQREDKDMSAELRFTSNSDGRLRYMLGVNYYQEDNVNFNLGQNNLTVLESRVLGVFGSLDFDITEELTLSAEGRFQSDKLDLIFDGFGGGLAANTAEPESQEYNKFMPRVILTYQPEGLNLNIYGSWSLSYLQGTNTAVESFNARVQPEEQLPADDIGFFTPTQKLSAFEVGVKHQLFDNFQYSIAAYYMDWSNQTFFQLSPTFVNANLAGDSEYKGIEVEANYRPVDWLVLSGGYNFVDAKFTNFVGAGSVASQILNPGLIAFGSRAAISSNGNKIRYIPAHEANVSADFDLEGVTGIESFFRADVLYTGSFFIDNFEYNKVDAAARVNIRAGANITEYLQVEVFGNNIFDNRRWQTNGGTTSGSRQPGASARRTFGVPVRGDEWGIRFTASF